MTSVTVITPSLPERAELLRELAAAMQAQTVDVLWRIAPDHDGVGPAVMRNAMACDATTEWLAFVDDDDLIYPHHIETLLAHSADADVVYTLCDVEGRAWQPEHDCSHESLTAVNTIPVTSLVRTTAFHKVGGFPLGCRDEDWGLWLALQRDNARIKCVHDVTWRYRFHNIGRGNRTWWHG